MLLAQAKNKVALLSAVGIGAEPGGKAVEPGGGRRSPSLLSLGAGSGAADAKDGGRASSSAGSKASKGATRYSDSEGESDSLLRR